MSNKSSDKYLKIVEWSEEDNCYIGTAPGLFAGGVHGSDEAGVFKELCEVDEDTIAIMKNSESLYQNQLQISSSPEE